MYRWIWVLCWFSYSAVAQEEATPSFQYQTDLTMSWINGIQKADFQEKNRTLGLTKAQIDLSWTRYHQTSLFLSLRPDALLTERKTQDERVFEFERRAGRVYQRAPQIEFLDLYQLQFDFSDSLSAGVGIYPDFYSRIEAYESPLTFSLLTLFPMKISALQLKGTKHRFPLALGTAPAGEEKSVDFALYAFNGSRDRVEKFSFSDQTFDSAPEVKQPRKGVAGSVTSYLNPQWTVFGLGGTFSSKQRETVNNNIIRTSYFAEASLQYRGHLYLPLLTSIDLRWAQDKWRSDVAARPAVNQQNISWKLQLEKDPSTSFLLGAYWGRSERPQKETSEYNKTLYEGHQLEAGVRRLLRGFLFGNLMVAYEKRMKRDEEGWKDGFATQGNTYTRPSIYRIAVELECILGSS